MKEGEDRSKIINQTISLGIFPFSCGWELGKSELHLNKTATDANCQKWWEVYFLVFICGSGPNPVYGILKRASMLKNVLVLGTGT